jgi:hypothetical protein
MCPKYEKYVPVKDNCIKTQLNLNSLEDIRMVYRLIREHGYKIGIRCRFFKEISQDYDNSLDIICTKKKQKH